MCEVKALGKFNSVLGSIKMHSLLSSLFWSPHVRTLVASTRYRDRFSHNVLFHFFIFLSLIAQSEAPPSRRGIESRLKEKATIESESRHCNKMLDVGSVKK